MTGLRYGPIRDGLFGDDKGTSMILTKGKSRGEAVSATYQSLLENVVCAFL